MLHDIIDLYRNWKNQIRIIVYIYVRLADNFPTELKTYLPLYWSHPKQYDKVEKNFASTYMVFMEHWLTLQE